METEPRGSKSQLNYILFNFFGLLRKNESG